VVRLQKHSAEANIYHDLFLGVELPKAPMFEQPTRSPSSGPAATTPSFLSTIIPPWQHIDDHDSLGLTPLICAIDQMDASKVDLLIDNCADVEVRDLDDKTPLLHAACKEDESMVVKLKKAGASMDAICKGLTVLHHMICAGKALMVRVLLENGAKIDFPGPNGFTPLLHAVLRDKVEKQNVTDLESRSITHALTGNCCPEPVAQASVVQALCYRETGDSLQKPNIDAQDKEGWTVVHHAIHNGRYDLLEVLLSNGADPNIGCRVGKTPLYHAIDRKQYRSAELLLRSSANVNAKDCHDRTPLLSAVRASNTYQLIELENEASIEWDKFDKPLNKDVRDLLKSSAERRESMSSARSSSSSGS
jgi:ankyrin repeat protein